MNYRSILLVGSGVVLGAVTLGAAANVSAHEENTAWQGRHAAHAVDANHPQRMGDGAIVVDLLGLSKQEIRDELESEKTIEQIVIENGFESLESFKQAVEDKVREDLADKGFSEEEIDKMIERHKKRIEERLENFNEDRFRERLENRGVSDEEISNRLQRIQQRINEFGE